MSSVSYPVCFKVFQIRDENKANDDKKVPRRDLVHRDDIPCCELMRVFPCAEVRRNIFGNPDKKGDQEECDGYRHAPNVRCDREFNPNTPKHDEDERNEDPSCVRQPDLLWFGCG